MKSKITIYIMSLSYIFYCFSGNAKIKFSIDDESRKIVKLLVANNYQEFGRYFDDSVTIFAFETGYTFSKKNNYDNYSAKKGKLYEVLFESNKVKKIFGYDLLCFKQAFGKSDRNYNSYRDDFNYIYAIIGELRYIISLKKRNNKFKIGVLTIEEI